MPGRIQTTARAELWAVLVAFQQSNRVKVFTDCKYVFKGVQAILAGATTKNFDTTRTFGVRCGHCLQLRALQTLRS